MGQANIRLESLSVGIERLTRICTEKEFDSVQAVRLCSKNGFVLSRLNERGQGFISPFLHLHT